MFSGNRNRYCCICGCYYYIPFCINSCITGYWCVKIKCLCQTAIAIPASKGIISFCRIGRLGNLLTCFDRLCCYSRATGRIKGYGIGCYCRSCCNKNHSSLFYCIKSRIVRCAIYCIRRRNYFISSICSKMNSYLIFIICNKSIRIC